MQAGKDLKAAFYVLYGPMTTLTVSVGRGVAIFAQDKDGVYQMLKNHVKIPEGNLYGSGGVRTEWLGKHAKFVNRIENEGAKNRYSGSFVADFHQILQYGGVYAYPPSEKQPNGKLRLVFEVNPIGFLAVQAGGAVSNGTKTTLDIVPEEVIWNFVILIQQNIELQTYAVHKFSKTNEVQTILTYLQVREDAMCLYGFSNQKEKMLFNDLLLVSGVGPKMAVSVLSGLPIEDIIKAIISSDVKTLSSIKGLGKKTAERIVLELNSKFGGIDSVDSLISANAQTNQREYCK